MLSVLFAMLFAMLFLLLIAAALPVLVVLDACASFHVTLEEQDGMRAVSR